MVGSDLAPTDKLVKEGLKVAVRIFDQHGARRGELHVVGAGRDEMLEILYVGKGLDILLKPFRYCQFDGIDAIPVVLDGMEEAADAVVGLRDMGLEEVEFRAEQHSAHVCRFKAREVWAVLDDGIVALVVLWCIHGVVSMLDSSGCEMATGWCLDS